MSLNTELIGLAVDLVVILTLVFGVYRPRHGKRDLVLSYVVLNIGVFGAVALLAVADGGLALGMGLFGILSIIRLRSTSISQTEVAYYFVALVLGTVYALGGANISLLVAVNLLLVIALVILDRGSAALAPAPPVIKQRIVLDTIHVSQSTLRADLTARLKTADFVAVIDEIDYTRAVTVVTVEMTAPEAEPAPVIPIVDPTDRLELSFLAPPAPTPTYAPAPSYPPAPTPTSGFPPAPAATPSYAPAATPSRAPAATPSYAPAATPNRAPVSAGPVAAPAPAPAAAPVATLRRVRSRHARSSRWRASSGTLRSVPADHGVCAAGSDRHLPLGCSGVRRDRSGPHRRTRAAARDRPEERPTHRLSPRPG